MNWWRKLWQCPTSIFVFQGIEAIEPLAFLLVQALNHRDAINKVKPYLDGNAEFLCLSGLTAAEQTRKKLFGAKTINSNLILVYPVELKHIVYNPTSLNMADGKKLNKSITFTKYA